VQLYGCHIVNVLVPIQAPQLQNAAEQISGGFGAVLDLRKRLAQSGRIIGICIDECQVGLKHDPIERGSQVVADGVQEERLSLGFGAGEFEIGGQLF
jgi:hypothetical protein